MAWADPRDRGRPSSLRTPALVLLAGASVLEGYASLGTIGASAFVVGPAGATLFAFGCLVLAVGLTRPACGARHTIAELCVRRASMLLAATTVALAVGVPGFGSGTVGAAELLVAATALAAAGASERRSVRRAHAASHPSRRSPEVAMSASGPAMRGRNRG
jgi:hypothetical protein